MGTNKLSVVHNVYMSLMRYNWGEWEQTITNYSQELCEVQKLVTIYFYIPLFATIYFSNEFSSLDLKISLHAMKFITELDNQP